MNLDKSVTIDCTSYHRIVWGRNEEKKEKAEDLVWGNKPALSCSVAPKAYWKAIEKGRFGVLHERWLFHGLGNMSF